MGRAHMVAIVAFLLFSQVALAQDATSGVEGTLPDVSVLGEGWTQYETGQPVDLIGTVVFAGATDWIDTGAMGVYTGPDASRIVIANMVVDQASFGVRGAWEDANNFLLMFAISIEPDYQSLMSLESAAPPSPCEEAKRIEGLERPYHMPAGVTMCAQGESNIWIFLVSGHWNGLTGAEASDALVGVVLGGI